MATLHFTDTAHTKQQIRRIAKNILIQNYWSQRNYAHAAVLSNCLVNSSPASLTSGDDMRASRYVKGQLG